MVHMAHAGSGDQRLKVYTALAARNRLVAILRIGLPALGVLVFLILSLQIYVAGVMRQYGISGVSIDRNHLVVETPTYSGVGGDGTRYSMTALRARTPLDNHDRIDLEQMSLTLGRPDGQSMTAAADNAQIVASTQSLVVDGVATVTGNAGVTGTLNGVTADLLHQSMVARGAVDLTLSNGASILAASMSYDATTQTWTFTRATVTIPGTPGEASAAPGPAPAGEVK